MRLRYDAGLEISIKAGTLRFRRAKTDRKESMPPLVTYTQERAGEKTVAFIHLDDGKNNLFSPQMQTELNQALDRAEQENRVVVLSGREGVLSAGFDLNVFKTGALNSFKMVTGGFALARRLLAFPTPVVLVCSGHAIAMGSFLLLSADYRIGAEGDFKIVANEVQIGLTMPFAAIEICTFRLKASHLDRALGLAHTYDPHTAVEAGFLDQVVAAEQIRTTALRHAECFASLDLEAHRKSKLRMRRRMLRKLDRALWKDKIDFCFQGARKAMGMK